MEENMIPSKISENNNKFYNNLIEYEEYFLVKENIAYKFIIGKRKNDIIIKCKNYEIKLNNNDLSLLTENILNTLDNAFDFMINIFEENKVMIKDITINKSIKLILKLNRRDNQKDIEMTLFYNKENKNLIFNELNNNYNKLKCDINSLKHDINTLLVKFKADNNNKKENKISKVTKNNSNSNPTNIQFSKDLIKDSYNDDLSFNNTFCAFKSINDILYLIYSNKNKSIISYDLINNRKINEIKKAHIEIITNFRYYLDKIKKQDLILSISDHNIKLWNINNYNCLLDIKNIYQNGWIYSACFLHDNNENYILSSNCNFGHCESIKVFNFSGNMIKEINDSNDHIYFIDTFYDKKLSTNYIITGNNCYVKSYDYNKNILYHKYDDKNNENAHHSIVVSNEEEIIKLIESSNDGNIRIWNFHSGELLNKIVVSDYILNCICLWNNEYIFVGCNDKTIKLIELRKGIILKDLVDHNKSVSTIKKIIHPIYGECILSQSYDNLIKLWIDKK